MLDNRSDQSRELWDDAYAVLYELGRTSNMRRFPEANLRLGQRILALLVRDTPEGKRHLPYLAAAAASLATREDLLALDDEQLCSRLVMVGKLAMVGYIQGRIDAADSPEAALGLWEDIVIGWHPNPGAPDFFLRRYIDGPTVMG